MEVAVVADFGKEIAVGFHGNGNALREATVSHSKTVGRLVVGVDVPAVVVVVDVVVAAGQQAAP